MTAGDPQITRALQRRGWTIAIVVAVAATALTLWWWFAADDLAQRERLSSCADEIEVAISRGSVLQPPELSACRGLKGAVIDASCMPPLEPGADDRRERLASCAPVYCDALEPSPALCAADPQAVPDDRELWREFWMAVLRHELDYAPDLVTNELETVADFLASPHHGARIEVTMPQKAQ